MAKTNDNTTRPVQSFAAALAAFRAADAKCRALAAAGTDPDLQDPAYDQRFSAFEQLTSTGPADAKEATDLLTAILAEIVSAKSLDDGPMSDAIRNGLCLIGVTLAGIGHAPAPTVRIERLPPQPALRHQWSEIDSVSTEVRTLESLLRYLVDRGDESDEEVPIFYLVANGLGTIGKRLEDLRDEGIAGSRSAPAAE